MGPAACEAWAQPGQMLGDGATLKQVLPRPREARSGHKSRLNPALSEAGGAWHGEPWSRVGCCPPVPPLGQPEQMSPCKHGFHFHTDVCGRGKHTTGRQKHDLKAKSLLRTMLPGVEGARESRVSHLSETVQEPDGALWRSIRRV